MGSGLYFLNSCGNLGKNSRNQSLTPKDLGSLISVNPSEKKLFVSKDTAGFEWRIADLQG
jgi:hypothetical protein